MGKVKVTEDHVEFKSYRDGSTIILSPESSIQAQKDIGADVSVIHRHVFRNLFRWCISSFSHPFAADYHSFRRIASSPH